MTVERLAFEDPEMQYHSYLAAQHVVRYAAVKNIVAGKRVLDVACGEGYGARLLRNWGAREVVGVDLFPSAIAAAKRTFGGEGVTFLVSDAEELERTFEGAEPFDLIVSFETIEHLARPERLLASLPRLLASDGAIVISCPNDRACSPEHDNPFHLEVYSFDAFKSLTQEYLGEASMWMLGAPLLGEMNFLPNDHLVQDKHDAQIAMTQTRIVENTVFIPAQSNLTTDEQTCSHYVGVWGTANVIPNAVISSLSVPAHREPWNALDYLQGRAIATHEPALARLQPFEPELLEGQAEVERLRSTSEGLTAENAQLSARIHELEPHIAKLADKAAFLMQEVGHLSQAKSGLQAERDALEAEKAALEDWIGSSLEPEIVQLSFETEKLRSLLSQAVAERDELHHKLQVAETTLRQLETKNAEYYEPELARLRSHVEHSTFEKEVQSLRSRLMAHAERSRLAAESIDALQRQLQEARARNAWHGPEIERLNRIVAEFEKTKREWWDPQLELRAARIAELEATRNER